MQIDAFQRGEMEVLAEVVDAAIPDVWQLARRGFVTTEDGLGAQVLGVDSPDVAERLVSRALARCLTPERRRGVDSADALAAMRLAEAQSVLKEHAIRAGAMVTVAGEELATEEPAADAGVEQRWSAMSDVAGEALGRLDERTRRLVELRFVEGKTAKEIASLLDCGAAAVIAHEKRVRHQVKHALQVAFPGEKVGAATIDALLSRQPLAPLPPPVTRERIRKDVLKRTFQEEPAPYRVRLAWGIAALMVASGLWLLMFADVLPYYGDDLLPEPRVEVACEGACRPGGHAKFRVLAPRDARRVAIGLRVPGRPAELLLASPSGRSIQLPIGARRKAVEIPYPSEIPSSLSAEDRAWAVAVFSEERLNRDQILGLTEGRISVAGVLTTSAALALE